MALFDSLRALLVGRPASGGQIIEYVGPTVSDVLGMGPEKLVRTQPHLRTVVTFLNRNIAQLPLPVYERRSDSDRRRDSGKLAQLLKRPNASMTTYDLLTALMGDFLLYDEAYWLVVEEPDSPSGWGLYPLPTSWVQQRIGGTAWAPDSLVIVNPKNGKRSLIESGGFIYFHGWNPGDPSRGMSPVDALRNILAEQIQAWTYREQVWARAGRMGSYITRPAGAPAWSDEARRQFGDDWKAKWTGRDGSKAGGTPILEDGMTLGSSRFNAREEEWSEVAKLSLATVAAVYHTSPTMVGILDNANFSNVKEFARMLYTDTLGPYLTMIESRINAFLLPIVEPGRDLYAEFNIAAKMAGSFEEQAAVLSTSVGRPWMTADEARARMNMPALRGDAEQLVTPLNVLVGGQASPRDSGSQNLAAGPSLSRKSAADPIQVKAAAREEDARVAEAVLTRFFKRQSRVVLSELGAKDAEWWDGERWDGELADDLYKLSLDVSEQVAKQTLETLGVDPSIYSTARTKNFLRSVAESRAALINAATLAKVEAALADNVGDGALTSTPAGVFEEAETSRAAVAGLTLATTLASFAVTESAKQMARPATTKTWDVQSGNPRASHASMNGETVGIEDTFSNGMNWPGDPAGGADEVAGCMCGVTVTIP